MATPLDERAREIVTDYFCFHEPDLMRNGKDQDYWIQKQTEAITSALTQVRRETLEEAVREAEAYGDACVLAEFTHGNKKATKHGVGASKAIADALRSRIQEGGR